LEASLERKFRDGMIFDKGISCNNVTFENISNTHADIMFGPPGSADGSIAYLIGDEAISAHAIQYYCQVNNLMLSMESVGKSLAGYFDSMESFGAERARLHAIPSKSDNRFALQSLLQQKVFTEGSLALSAQVSSVLDTANTDNNQGDSLVHFEFLSLILRCWSAHYCLKEFAGREQAEISDAQKVQLSLDFLKRMNDGGYAYLQAEIEATVVVAKSAGHCDILGEYAAQVEGALARHVDTTQHYISQIVENSAGKGEPTVVINSHEYVLFTGHLCVAWMWLKQGVAAHNALTNPEMPESDKHFYLGKISALDYFCNYELVKTLAQSDMLKKNPQILDFAETDWLLFSQNEMK
jgi:butyryl-CoA dehydrogenase